MEKSKLLLSRCNTPADWDSFVAASPQGSIFCQTAFLDALENRYDLWFLEEAGRPQAGVVILLQDNKVMNAPFPFTLYQGILFAEHGYALPPHRRSSWILKMTESLLEALTQEYSRLSFCLHYAHNDLRGLQWFHYHEPEKGQFKFNLYYTGLIDLATPPDFESYLATIRQTRRNVYKQALSHGLIAEQSRDVDILDRLHRLTFARQGIDLREQANKLVQSITTAAISSGFGELLICKTAAGETASATLFLYDRKFGYYLFGANDPAHHKTNSGTFLLLENIKHCYERSIRCVDVVGINSPNRGDFKTSCNAMPMPYFTATWEQPPGM
jgi:Acetyltransferase (GNAT) domain